MAASPSKTQIRLTLTVAIGDEQADIDFDPTKKVRDIIADALLAFNIDENANTCHLAGPDRLYLPHDGVGDIDIENGATLSLRLPF